MMKKITLFFIFIFLTTPVLKAQDRSLDVLSLAAHLIKNQSYSRAEQVLKQIEDPHDVIPERYFALWGALGLEQKRFQKALDSFEQALNHDPENPEFYLGKARAQLALKDSQRAIETLNLQQKRLQDLPEFYQVMASAHFESGLASEGWDYLQKGNKRFSKHLPTLKQKWHYLMEHQLVEASFKTAQMMLTHEKLVSLDVARMAMRYRELGEMQKAMVLGEAARLMDPEDEEVLKDLARTYLKDGRTLAAAQILTDYAREFNPEFLAQASELWYQAGRPAYAKALVLDIRDPLLKTKKSLGLALKEKDYFHMASLHSGVMRSSLKTEEEILYALAYAHFQQGDFKLAKKTLLNVRRPDLFQKVVSLKEAIKSCQTGESLCWGE